MQFPREETIEVIWSKDPLFPSALGLMHLQMHSITGTPNAPTWIHVIMAFADNTGVAQHFLGWLLTCSAKHIHISRFQHALGECELYLFVIKAKYIYEQCIAPCQDVARILRVARAMGVANLEGRTLEELKADIKGRF